jgi:hypothetical protein
MGDLLTPPMIEAAHFARWCFEPAERSNGVEYLRLRRRTPAWVKELVFAAHGRGELLPDDWRYVFAHEGLDYIATAEPDTSREELASTIDPDLGPGSLARWLGSNLVRFVYCDQVLAEFGTPERTFDLLASGQLLERQEVFGLLWDSIDEHVAGRG